MVWINDCEYNLIPVISKSSDEFDLYVNARGGYRCSIIALKGDCAVIETNFENEKFTSEICKARK
ncbi:hypothetical protein [Chryseobacterium lathyri]|uniref:hypothetical protein n=1 Tax=Chryseobacterium lathyri TaxID=395933 RepID=UPI001CBDD659|nr:hypothetical protein [Chryseobacterium lathyri]